ncbi:hypothetical protein RND71_011283 [Anisodus tanguticus]|uniref:Paired amphipathic helix protein Sin3-like 2 n=1 Tax=Anisodus tanguticus TaxID=243964 RepID=A0AAE1SEL1_9SOLA|nr:hypothetical protein RND71_011283 [Anisodus tanguticus]
MGLLRVFVYGTARFKRTNSSSRRKLYGQSQVPESSLGGGRGGSRICSRCGSRSASRDGPGASDAVSYLKKVKDTFQDKMEKYHMFLDVIMGFKNQRIDTGDVIEIVKDLFKGHPSLILGFQPFLPKGYEITLNDDDEAPPTKSTEFEQAVSLVNKIKKRLRNVDHAYKSFIDIVCSHRKEHKDINEVYHEVSIILNDHPDLLDEFTRFLPDSATVNLLPPKRFPTGSAIGPMDSAIGPHAERDLSIECPDLADDKILMKLYKEPDNKKMEI